MSEIIKKPVVLFEDNHIIVVVKPANMLVQGDNTGDEDVLTWLKAYIKEKYNKPGEAFVGLVHRMDRPVGGLLVFARTSKAAARLSDQVRTHELCREYVCVAQGEAPDRFTLHDWLQKDETTNMVKVIPSYLKLQGKEAILHGRCMVHRSGHSLVCIRLETGRAHQIRVQMQHAGYPLWGDARYGNGKRGQQIALWGMRLTLKHPITGENMLFIAPPPEAAPWTAFTRELDGLESIWPQIILEQENA